MDLLALSLERKSPKCLSSDLGTKVWERRVTLGLWLYSQMPVGHIQGHCPQPHQNKYRR